MARATVLKRFELSEEEADWLEMMARASSQSQTGFVRELIRAAYVGITTAREVPASPDVQTESKAGQPKRVKGERRAGQALVQAKAANAEIASKQVFDEPMPDEIRPTYCPRHRPKPCAADCKYRVRL